jgi:hypothetical protein
VRWDEEQQLKVENGGRGGFTTEGTEEEHREHRENGRKES